MNILKAFERKKEYDPEKEKRKEVKEYLENLEALNEISWLKKEEREENFQYLAEKILDLLPEEVKVLEISKDIYAKREDMSENHIEDSEVKNLDWVEKFCKKKD